MTAKLLVVDDDMDIRNLLHVFLSGCGYKVAMASNGREALELMQVDPPDILITDVMMPEMNGYQLVQYLSTDYEFPLPKIIILTSRTDPADVQKGLGVGADMFITKPFDMNELADQVAELLKEK